MLVVVLSATLSPIGRSSCHVWRTVTALFPWKDTHLLPKPRDTRPELLSPAGSVDALHAAVAAGADAVYLGLADFNARRGADNFNLQTLEEACEFAHLRGVRVYLTANVAMLPRDVGIALSMVADAHNAGVDAVIVQDIGLMHLIAKHLPEMRVHASTQMNVHSSASVEAVAALGASRITLARETSLSEIARLAAVGEALGVEVETFTHGALCVCYSGQCLMSSLIGGRSANRGECAQPCRLPYELQDRAENSLADVGAHLLSPRDLAAITVLPGLIATGTAALKLEGRMKSAEYVALVTGVYRAALDRALADPDSYEVRDGEMAVLAEAFSRGFSEAYLTSERGNDMMSYRRPNNRGVPLGRVSSFTGGRATIELTTAAAADDTIEVWTSRGRFAQALGQMTHSGAAHANAPAGTSVEVALDEPVSSGDRVFRVRNADLTAAAARLFADPNGPAIPMRFEVSVVVGHSLTVRVTDASGDTGAAEGPVVEPARTKAVTAEEIAEHVGRLGNTPYVAADWDIQLSANSGIGYSVLHKVRRDAIDDYERTVLAPWSNRSAAAPNLVPSRARRTPQTSPRVVAVVSDARVAMRCLAAGADEVQVPAWALGDEVPDGMVPLVPRVCHDSEMDAMHSPVLSAGRGVAGTLGSIRRLAEKAEMQAHWSLNALNPYSVDLLAEMGCASVWLSPELTAEQIADIARSTSVELGVAVAGRQELMVTEHCVLMAEGECDQNCGGCARRAQSRVLKDRKGYLFPVVTDITGRTHIYNAVPLDATSALADLLKAGVRDFRADLETEDASTAEAVVRSVRQALIAAISGGRPGAKAYTDSTTGHYFRGLR